MDTRAIDEDAINDINIYFFGNNINYHFYYPEYARRSYSKSSPEPIPFAL